MRNASYIHDFNSKLWQTFPNVTTIYYIDYEQICISKNTSILNEYLSPVKMPFDW